MNRLTTLLLSISFAVGCSPKQKNWDKLNVRSLEVEDPRLTAAMDKAQSNMDNFVSSFTANSGDTLWAYFVKYGVMKG